MTYLSKKNYKANIITKLEIIKENALKKWKDRNSQQKICPKHHFGILVLKVQYWKKILDDPNSKTEVTEKRSGNLKIDK